MLRFIQLCHQCYIQRVHIAGIDRSGSNKIPLEANTIRKNKLKKLKPNPAVACVPRTEAKTSKPMGPPVNQKGNNIRRRRFRRGP